MRSPGLGAAIGAGTGPNPPPGGLPSRGSPGVRAGEPGAAADPRRSSHAKPRAAVRAGTSTGGDEDVWCHQDWRRKTFRELLASPTRGGIIPRPGCWTCCQTGPPLSTKTGWANAKRSSAKALQLRRETPFQRRKVSSITSPATPPSCRVPSMSSRSPVARSTKCAAASSKTPWATEDVGVSPCTRSGTSCAPGATGSPLVSAHGSKPRSPPNPAHINA